MRRNLPALADVPELVQVAAGLDGIAQRLLVELAIQVCQASLRGPLLVENDAHRLQHGRTAPLGTLAHFLLSELDRVARAAGHAGEKLAIHLDEVIERGLLRLDEEARDQRVPLRGCEPAQVAGAIVVAEAGQLLDDLGVQVAVSWAPRRPARAGVATWPHSGVSSSPCDASAGMSPITTISPNFPFRVTASRRRAFLDPDEIDESIAVAGAAGPPAELAHQVDADAQVDAGDRTAAELKAGDTHPERDLADELAHQVRADPPPPGSKLEANRGLVVQRAITAGETPTRSPRRSPSSSLSPRAAGLIDLALAWTCSGELDQEHLAGKLGRRGDRAGTAIAPPTEPASTRPHSLSCSLPCYRDR